jgi:hypothetical protein
MKQYFTIFLLFSITLLQAQNDNFSVKQGGYFTEEIGGYGILPILITWLRIRQIAE